MFDSPSLNLRKCNLIYGLNRSRKITLFHLFSSLEAGEPHAKLPEGCANVRLRRSQSFVAMSCSNILIRRHR